MYRRGAVTLYTALSQRLPVRRGVAYGLDRMLSIVATELQQAKNRQAQRALEASGSSATAGSSPASRTARSAPSPRRRSTQARAHADPPRLLTAAGAAGQGVRRARHDPRPGPARAHPRAHRPEARPARPRRDVTSASRRRRRLAAAERLHGPRRGQRARRARPDPRVAVRQVHQRPDIAALTDFPHPRGVPPKRIIHQPETGDTDVGRRPKISPPRTKRLPPQALEQQLADSTGRSREAGSTLPARTSRRANDQRRQGEDASTSTKPNCTELEHEQARAPMPPRESNAATPEAKEAAGAPCRGIAKEKGFDDRKIPGVRSPWQPPRRARSTRRALTRGDPRTARRPRQPTGRAQADQQIGEDEHVRRRRRGGSNRQVTPAGVRHRTRDAATPTQPKEESWQTSSRRGTKFVATALGAAPPADHEGPRAVHLRSSASPDFKGAEGDVIGIKRPAVSSSRARRRGAVTTRSSSTGWRTGRSSSRWTGTSTGRCSSPPRRRRSTRSTTSATSRPPRSPRSPTRSRRWSSPR